MAEQTQTNERRKTPLLDKHGAMVVALSTTPPQFRKKIIEEAPSDLINCVAECCHNVLKGNVSLSEDQLRRLHPKRQLVRELADKSVPVQRKKELLNQKGGFLPAFLLPVLAPIVAKSLVKLIDKI